MKSPTAQKIHSETPQEVKNKAINYSDKLVMTTEEKLIHFTLEAKRLRDEQNVLIQIYNNASGYLWALAKNDSGTDLGWSEEYGDCQVSGTFTTYEKALEDAVTLVSKYTLSKFQEEWKHSFHWGLYADHLNNSYR